MLTVSAITALATATSEISVAYTMVGLFVVTAAAVGIAWRGMVSIFRTIRRANETIDALQEIIREWNGEPASNGDPGRPSYPVRMANMERALAALAVPIPRPRPNPRRGMQ